MPLHVRADAGVRTRSVIRFREPGEAAIRRFLAGQAGQPFTYAAVGATRAEVPARYTVDRNRKRLGHGSADFDRARDLLRSWRMFDLGWVRSFPSDAPIREGTAVAVIAQAAGLTFLNATRIVYAFDEGSRFGFAYGTLPDHVESGEERFSIEIDPADGSVWYDLLAFSRPRHPLARLGYPVTRRLQRRFARDSMAVMASAMRPSGV